MFWNWSWAERIVSVVFLAIVAAILYPVFARPRESGGHRNGCQSNLRQIGLGLIQYTQDYDEKFPLVATIGSAFGWADALQPYLKSTQIFHCPVARNPAQTDPKQTGYTDFPFNARMNGKSLGKISEPSRQIVSLDGNDGTDQTDARYAFSQIPFKWREDTNSPLYRHKGVGNYLFADGHVKGLSPSHMEHGNRFVF